MLLRKENDKKHDEEHEGEHEGERGRDLLRKKLAFPNTLPVKEAKRSNKVLL